MEKTSHLSLDRSLREEEEVLNVAHTSMLPPSTQRGKSTNPPIEPSSPYVRPHSDKGKCKEIPSSTVVAIGEFDYMNFHWSNLELRS